MSLISFSFFFHDNVSIMKEMETDHRQNVGYCGKMKKKIYLLFCDKRMYFMRERKKIEENF